MRKRAGLYGISVITVALYQRVRSKTQNSAIEIKRLPEAAARAGPQVFQRQGNEGPVGGLRRPIQHHKDCEGGHIKG
jgi:hypothetical protein